MDTEDKIKELFKKHSNMVSLSEGDYDYMMDEKDFKEAILEFINFGEKE